MYLPATLSDLSSLFVCLTLFLIIFLFLHCEPLCPNLSQFCHFLYNKDSPWPNVIFHCGSKFWLFFFYGWQYFACIEILGNHIFSLFSRRVWLGSMLDFPYVSNTRLLDIFESLLRLTILRQSSVIFWSVRSGSFSNFDKTLRLISTSFADTRPFANIRHLKLSADNSSCYNRRSFYWQLNITLIVTYI